ncbi:MAG: N-acyl homoserine lactonase family protein [Acetomicrobium flavidum]|uniref:N-acyl homoserine lactonase family protein n=1 Tax=Acetomicrobium flavidum TaxID=49896 RepID=UPI0016A9FE74|nr:N-acyl homoserine lactonase family protein [Acetomicrobium flavidum]
MSKIKLYPIYVGSVAMDKSYLTAGRGIGQIVTVPVPCFLIEHPKGLILFDTGMSKELIDNPDPVKRIGPIIRMSTPIMKKGEDIVSQLDKLGIKPKDIKYVVNSHLHFDHAGNNADFPDSTFIVQKTEIRIAYWPEVYQKFAYLRADFDHPLNYQTIEGDVDLFGDGTIQLWLTAGHSQGHQSMVVKLQNSGYFILTGDSCYMKENIDELVLPGIVWSPDEAIRSLMKMREARDKLNATVILGHDFETWNKIKHAPDYYD